MDDRISTFQVLGWLALLFGCAVLFFAIIFIPPVEAETWGDDFTKYQPQFYNISTGFSWSESYGAYNWSSTGSTSQFPFYYNGQFRAFTIKINASFITPYGTPQRARAGIIINSLNNASNVAGALGNNYVFYVMNSNFSVNNSQTGSLYRYVAGGSTVLKTVTLDQDTINQGAIFNISMKRDNETIDVFVNSKKYAHVIDSTFVYGFSGFTGSISSLTQYYDFFINETPTSSFSCTTVNPVTCTQDGTNFNDPGTRSWWVWGDGTTSNAVNATHTYLPGTYTVSLLNENVAGSSSEVKRDYIKVADTSGQGLVINPSIRNKCPWWHFGLWC